MTIQSEQVERSNEVQERTDVRQLDAIVAHVCQDSRTNSRQYIEETTVPRGGE